MSNMTKTMAVFSGSTYPELAEEIAKELGVKLGDIRLEKFANGEIYARYMDSVRGADVFLIQSVAGPNVNDALMELLIMVDAAKRASARTITAVLPHYGYSRQDRKAAPREPITAKLVADMLTTAGVDRTITIDLHQGQIEGYFDTPVNHLTALWLMADYFMAKNLDTSNLCIVSPDLGRAKAAKKLAGIMGAELVILHKDRPKHNAAEITALIGNVEGKTCILNDDMIDTAGSITAAVSTLKKNGAEKVYVCATHPVFSGPAYERLASPEIEEVVVCNTIPIPKEHLGGKIKQVSVAPLFARAIQNVFYNNSIAVLFDKDFAL